MKKISKRWVIALVIIALGSGCYLYFSRAGNKSSVTYKTAKAAKETLTVAVSGTGNVVVDKSVNVNPSISGQVTDLAVKYGDQVTKGQTLFKVKNDQLDIAENQAYASYLQAKEAVTNDQTQVDLAKSNQTTVNSNSMSSDTDKTNATAKVTEAQSNLQIAQLNEKTALSSYNLAKSNAELRTVTAPMDGTVTTLNINDGDQLGSSSGGSSGGSQANVSSSGSTSSSSTSSSVPIVIDDLSTLKASVAVNEADIAQVKVDQKVNMTFDAIDGLTLTGKVNRVSTVGTETSGVVTYPVEISFDSVDSRVKPKMSVTAEITTEVKQNVLTVANSAIKTSGNTTYVQVMKNGKPVNQVVETGAANDTSTEITSGLSEGMTVVTATITKTSTTKTSSSTSNKSNIRGLTGDSGFGGGPSGGTPPAN